MSHDSLFFSSFALFVQDVTGTYREAQTDKVLQAAKSYLLGRIRHTEVFESPKAVQEFLRMRPAALEYEVFAVMHLTHRTDLLNTWKCFEARCRRRLSIHGKLSKRALLVTVQP